MEKTAKSSIIVLGSTGSVGEQALDVARQSGASVLALSANRNAKRIAEQAREFGVRACAMADEQAAKELRLLLADTNVHIYSGMDGICQMIAEVNGEDPIVVNSIIGEAGLKPTLATLEVGKRLALANKESLVCAGELVMKLAKEKNIPILPVDSEHSAIYQCLRAGNQKEIKRILLTASGGPFYGRSKEELAKITVADALAHPTWKMGAKITIDSATLMNKGFEVIEAVHLFGVLPEQIKVLVHRESIMHSAVEYTDHSIIAQFSVPDMRLCVQYALTHPNRTSAVIQELDLTQIGALTFAEPDIKTFPLLGLAIHAIHQGGAVPAVLNAANEVAVAAFLKNQIGLPKLFCVVEDVVSALESQAKQEKTLAGIFHYDQLARENAERMI